MIFSAESDKNRLLEGYKMKYIQNDKKHAPTRENKRTSGRFVKIFLAVAAVTVAVATTFAMMLPAMTLTADGEPVGIQPESQAETQTETQAETTAFATEQDNQLGSPNDNGDDQIDLSGTDLKNYKDFEEYLESVGGEIESLLYDSGSNLVDNYAEASGSGYSFYLYMSAPYIVPDSYYYFLPKGMSVEAMSRQGEITNGSVAIGTFEISDDNSFILFKFDERCAQYQNILGQINFSVSFEERMQASVSKTGWLIGPDYETDGYFHWKITAQIPGDREGAVKREWKINDRSEVTEQWAHDFGDPENAKNTHVYLTYGDVERREIFNIRDVYKNEGEDIAYYTNSDNKYLYLACRMLPGESEDERCVTELPDEYEGWNTCWRLGQNATLEIEYKNVINGADGSNILSNQNAVANGDITDYENKVFLTGSYYNSWGELNTDIHKALANVEIATFVEKEEFSYASRNTEYTSDFRITFNRAMADLSKLDRNGDGEYDDEVILVDNMKNLMFVPGSLKITAIDADGNETELNEGEDFYVEDVRNEEGTKAVIHIRVLGRYMYRVEYAAKVIVEKDQKIVEISNSASLMLYDDADSAFDPTYHYSRRLSYDERWDFVRYEVTVNKVDYDNHAVKLKGAKFGLYTNSGALIAEQETGDDGTCKFATNVSQGLIFRTNMMYYIQEISPPEGYDVNNACYRFYFSEGVNTALEDDTRSKYPGAEITHVEQGSDRRYLADLTVTDEKLFTLPETGADGTGFYVTAGMVLLAVSAGIYIIVRKLKQ